jgi:hypothetical protein
MIRENYDENKYVHIYIQNLEVIYNRRLNTGAP